MAGASAPCSFPPRPAMAPSRGPPAAASSRVSRAGVALAVPVLLFLAFSLLPGVGSETSPGPTAGDEAPRVAPAQGVVGRDELQQFLLWLRRNAVFGIGDTVSLCALSRVRAPAPANLTENSSAVAEAEHEGRSQGSSQGKEASAGEEEGQDEGEEEEEGEDEEGEEEEAARKAAELAEMQAVEDFLAPTVAAVPLGTEAAQQQQQQQPKCLRASKTLRKGAIVLSVPFSAALLLSPHHPEPYPGAGPELALLALLLRESGKGNASFFAPLLRLFPSSPRLPWLALPPALLRILHHEPTVRRAQDLQLYARQLYEASDPALLGFASLDSFLWALGVVYTRHFSVALPASASGEGHLFAPLSDFLVQPWESAAPLAGDVEWSASPLGDRLELHALRRIPQGKILVEASGVRRTEQSLLFLGVVPLGESADQVVLFQSLEEAALFFLRASAPARWPGDGAAGAPGADPWAFTRLLQVAREAYHSALVRPKRASARLSDAAREQQRAGAAAWAWANTAYYGRELSLRPSAGAAVVGQLWQGAEPTLAAFAAMHLALESQAGGPSESGHSQAVEEGPTRAAGAHGDNATVDRNGSKAGAEGRLVDGVTGHASGTASGSGRKRKGAQKAAREVGLRILRMRCAELLYSFPTTESQDRHLLARQQRGCQLEGLGARELAQCEALPWEMARLGIQYRLGVKELLHSLLSANFSAT